MSESPKPRKRNMVWDTVAEIWFGGTVPTGQLTRIGGIVRDLTQMGATPESIHARAEAAKRSWGRPFGPEALVKHWGLLADARLTQTQVGDPDFNAFDPKHRPADYADAFGIIIHTADDVDRMMSGACGWPKYEERISA